MKILLIAKHDIVGGACRASYRLHLGLRELGADNRLMVLDKRTMDDRVKEFQPERNLGARIKRRIGAKLAGYSLGRYHHTRPTGVEHFSMDWPGVGGELLAKFEGVDIINIHWVSGFLDLPKFYRQIPREIPIIITLHDMNAFTGGCHYSSGCEGFRLNCGFCPQLGSASATDLSSSGLRRKKRALNKRNDHRVRVIAPSRWLAAQASVSSLFEDIKVDVIPYGLETGIFRPHDRKQARDALGIPVDAPVIAFSAGSLASRRKGFDILVEAMRELAKQMPALHILSLGSRNKDEDLGVTHISCGLLSNDNLIAFCLSAADVFVIPTREDNLPNTVLEAMACGLPIVGSAVGGVVDMVEPEVNGLLFPSENAHALAAACQRLLVNPSMKEGMGVNSRKIAVTRYGLVSQATAYLEIFDELMAAKR